MILVLMGGTQIRADLLDRTTAIEPTKNNCYMQTEPEITEITIEPGLILEELENIKGYQRYATSKIIEQNAQYENTDTMEKLLTKSIDMESNTIDYLIDRQKTLINLLTQSISFTTDYPYKNIRLDRITLLDTIPTITREFSTNSSFDKEFVRSQELRLDERISDAIRKVPETKAKAILQENRNTMSIQFQAIFGRKFPQNTKIGFADSTTPRNFIEFFKDTIKPNEWRKLLTLTQLIKSTILFQLEQEINSDQDRSSNWFNSIAKKATDARTKQYKYKAARAKINTKTLQRARPKRHPLLALAGKAILSIFAAQAKSLAVKMITKHTTNNRLKKEEENMDLNQRIIPSNGQLPELTHIALAQTEQLKTHVGGKTQNFARKGHETRQDYHIKNAYLRANIALVNTKILREYMTQIEENEHRIENLKRIQEIQYRYAESLFTQRLPLDLIDSIRGSPLAKCKASITLEEKTFRIRYSYFADIKEMATFKIQTTPFLIEGKSFTLKLPNEIAILPDGKYTIPDPRQICGNDCLCDEGTIIEKLDPCLEQILLDKYAGKTQLKLENCRDYLIPTENKQRAIRYKQDHYSIFTPEATIASIDCGKNRDTTELQPGLNRVEIPVGCKLDTQKLKIKNNHIPTETIPLVQENNVTEEKAMLTENKDDLTESLAQVVRKLNYNENNDIDTATLKTISQLRSRIDEIEMTDLTQTIITAAITIIITIIMNALITNILAKPMAECRKNIVVCGCCCTVRPKEEVKIEMKPINEKEEELLLDGEYNKNYPELYMSQLSITSTETKQDPIPTPRNGEKSKK